MEQEEDVQRQLLAHAERQTKAIENINTALMRTLAVFVFLSLVGLVVVLMQ